MKIEDIFTKYRSFWILEAKKNLGICREDAEDILGSSIMECIEKGKEDISIGYLKARFFSRCVDLIRVKPINSDDIEEFFYNSFSHKKNYWKALADLIQLSNYDEELRLRYVEGLSLEDISGKLNISRGALGMRLSRGREEIKEHLKGNKELFDCLWEDLIN